MPDDEDKLTEQVVDTLVMLEETPHGATASGLAKSIGVSKWKVLQELQILEAHGLVYRTGAKRGTRWWTG